MRRAILLGLMFLCVSAAAQETDQHPVVNRAAAAKFVTLANVPECMTAFVERGDPGTGPSVVLIRMKPRCDSFHHWHTSGANVTALSGALGLDMKGEKTISMQRGDFIFLPAHHIHGERCLGSVPCMFLAQLFSPFDVHYVDVSGKEISLAEASKAAAKSTR